MSACGGGFTIALFPGVCGVLSWHGMSLGLICSFCGGDQVLEEPGLVDHGQELCFALSVWGVQRAMDCWTAVHSPRPHVQELHDWTTIDAGLRVLGLTGALSPSLYPLVPVGGICWVWVIDMSHCCLLGGHMVQTV